jgi:hypothetical protein
MQAKKYERGSSELVLNFIGDINVRYTLCQSMVCHMNPRTEFEAI